MLERSFIVIALVLVASMANAGRFTALPSASAPLTTDNDDSCDIGVTPAATLLLPYFEIDAQRTTVFSVTNVSAMPQIARVTIWTDWSFPVLTFNLFLTGYDVQPVNLTDVIVQGTIGSGTSVLSPEGALNRTGTRPLWNLSNPNFAVDVSSTCAEGRFPGVLPDGVAADVRAALTRGRSRGSASCAINGVEQQVGGNHGDVAIGYVTIDVVNTCSHRSPADSEYYKSELLFDNVLIGDYHEVNRGTASAGGNTLVHIRAVPEGGPAGSIPTGVTNLPYTFYDRYTVGNVYRSIDRRQPLPSVFAARWISGKTAAFDTQYKIWREGQTNNQMSCNTFVENSNLRVSEMVRFDERENANMINWNWQAFPWTPGLPSSARVPVTSSSFPANTSTDVGGWMFMTLNNNSWSQTYSVNRGAGSWWVAAGAIRPSQNWVVVSMTAQDQYAIEYDAAWLGNGCSPASPLSGSAVSGKTSLLRIGPTGGALPCPLPALECTGTNINP